jgi:hypothetical protein
MLIATNVFTPVCRATARLGGLPEIRWATVPHPIGSLNAEELLARAQSAVEQFVDIITNRR